MIAPALITLAEKLIWTGEFDEAEQWLRRAARALQADDGPGIRFRLHLVTGMPHAGRSRHPEALEEFRAAERRQPQLVSSLALASQVSGWTLATQARLGMTGEACAALAAATDENAGSGEIRNAGAVICLADGDPAAALAAVADVLDGTAHARQLSVSPNTVRTHLRRMYAKLGVGDRSSAVQRARELRLLADSTAPAARPTSITARRPT